MKNTRTFKDEDTRRIKAELKSNGKMKLWIARDQYNDAYGRGSVTLHLYKPSLSIYGRWVDDTVDGFMCILSKGDFPEVTFENSPQEVELKLVK